MFNAGSAALCRFRSGERHGQSSRLRLGGEAESPLEKLQVDNRPGAKEGLSQAVSLRWTDFQHASKCRPLTSGYNSNRVADLHDAFSVALAVHGHPSADVGGLRFGPTTPPL